ncbi:MAG: RnfABCDGE type electron transport complex subunit B [Fusobacteria bacterium]|nr:RnfABCDGE type electron transport complex subunit B [Fusobacteriota bacterium]
MLISVCIIAALGLIFGAFLGYAAKKFGVEKDERIEKIIAILPGINCGSCNCVGCSDYAEKVVSGSVKSNLCTPGGESVAFAISEVMGVQEIEIRDTMVARVRCQGNHYKTIKKYELDTVIKSCSEARLYFHGDKSCIYGCLGYGDCVSHCPFGAIVITPQGIAEVKDNLCVGCGKCVKTCPKQIIKLQNMEMCYTVLCSSKEHAHHAKIACDIACIACGKCAEICPNSAILMEHNLAKIDYEKCNSCGLCALKCPTNAIYSEIKDCDFVEIVEEKCIGCTKCKNVCPFNAISGELKHVHKVSEKMCVGCGFCEKSCPTQAIVRKNK